MCVRFLSSAESCVPRPAASVVEQQEEGGGSGSERRQEGMGEMERSGGGGQWVIRGIRGEPRSGECGAKRSYLALPTTAALRLVALGLQRRMERSCADGRCSSLGYGTRRVSTLSGSGCQVVSSGVAARVAGRQEGREEAEGQRPHPKRAETRKRVSAAKIREGVRVHSCLPCWCH